MEIDGACQSEMRPLAVEIDGSRQSEARPLAMEIDGALRYFAISFSFGGRRILTIACALFPREIGSTV